MKKTIVLVAIMFLSLSNAQETKQIPQININGEGKIKVIPDQAVLLVTVETKGNNVKDVKRTNDEQVEQVVKFIKKMNLDPTDFRTQRVSLNPQYDYEKKKSNYNATQTIEILLKDLSKYDELVEGLVNQGVNRIDNVVFQSSKLVHYQSEARKLAMKDAKIKAEDYVSVLGQKIGKALAISDNSQNYYPSSMPVYAMKGAMMDRESAPRETLAIGEINITANVSVSFILE